MCFPRSTADGYAGLVVIVTPTVRRSLRGCVCEARVSRPRRLVQQTRSSRSIGPEARPRSRGPAWADRDAGRRASAWVARDAAPGGGFGVVWFKEPGMSGPLNQHSQKKEIGPPGLRPLRSTAYRGITAASAARSTPFLPADPSNDGSGREPGRMGPRRSRAATPSQGHAGGAGLLPSSAASPR